MLRVVKERSCHVEAASKDLSCLCFPGLLMFMFSSFLHIDLLFALFHMCAGKLLFVLIRRSQGRDNKREKQETKKHRENFHPLVYSPSGCSIQSREFGAGREGVAIMLKSQA